MGGDLVTMSGKVIRPRVLERYKGIVDGIYSSGAPKKKGTDAVPYRPG
jgi:hypothetical protein